jgi:hypothetical protein
MQDGLVIADRGDIRQGALVEDHWLVVLEGPRHECRPGPIRSRQDLQGANHRDRVHRDPERCRLPAFDAVLRQILVPRRGLSGVALLDQQVIVEQADLLGAQQLRRDRPPRSALRCTVSLNSPRPSRKSSASSLHGARRCRRRRSAVARRSEPAAMGATVALGLASLVTAPAASRANTLPRAANSPILPADNVRHAHASQLPVAPGHGAIPRYRYWSGCQGADLGKPAKGG